MRESYAIHIWSTYILTENLIFYCKLTSDVHVHLLRTLCVYYQLTYETHANHVASLFLYCQFTFWAHV